VKRIIWVLLVLLTACKSTDIGPNALAITSPASGSPVSGTIAVQVGTADNTNVTRVELYVRGQGSTVKGMMVGSSVNEPHVISWNSLSQPNATNLELVAVAIDKEGKETPSPALPIRTQNSGTPQLQYLVGYTLAPKVSATQLELASSVLLTDGVLPPKDVDLSKQEVSLQALETSQRNT
jgi:Bacterial Ig domain